jgi:hypothetical protein
MATGSPVKHSAHRLTLPGDWRPTRPVLRRRAGGQQASQGGARKQATWWLTFRAWRHTRPFWGGLLLVLAGLELLAIPLSGILSRGAVRLVVYIGIGGVFGVLIGILLITAGIAVWMSPVHRVFYGIAGVVMGIASFPTSNLGGFFLCMLLAIIGGSIAFAWAPGVPVASVPVASVPADEAPTAPLQPGEPPDDDVPDDNVPDDEVPAGEVPAGDAPAGDAPAGPVSERADSAEQAGGTA